PVHKKKTQTCDQQIVQETARLANKVEVSLKPLPPRKAGRKPEMDKLAGEDMREKLYLKLGVDLTAIEGVGLTTALTLLTEVGPDLSRFPSEKHFCSWLGLCPDNRISGGGGCVVRNRPAGNRGM